VTVEELVLGKVEEIVLVNAKEIVRVCAGAASQILEAESLVDIVNLLSWD
jgi:hypothetical protein